MGQMYFKCPNCEKTQLLPVIAVPITNNVSSDDLAVTEVMKVTLSNSAGWEDTIVDTESNSPTKEGWQIITRGGQKSILTQRYEPSTGKTVTWNVMATDVDVEIERVSQAGYCDICNITDQDEITLASVHHRMYFEAANVGAGVGDDFKNRYGANLGRPLKTTKNTYHLTNTVTMVVEPLAPPVAWI